MSDEKKEAPKTLHSRKEQFKGSAVISFFLAVVAYAVSASFSSRLAQEMSLAQRIPTQTVSYSTMAGYTTSAQIAMIVAGVCCAICFCAVMLWLIADLLEIAQRENA